MKVDCEKLIEIKAGITCFGLKLNGTVIEVNKEQHPTAHRRTGNIGVHIYLGGWLVTNAVTGESYCENSPYSLERTKEGLMVLKDGQPACDAKPVPTPKWYMKRTSDGTLMADILLQEGDRTLITAVWNNCCYFSNGTQCKFCGLVSEKGVEYKNVEQVVEATLAALEENPNYYLHLTGGNTFTPDHGIKYYEKYVKAVRSKADVPISLEISPPDDTKYIDELVKAGARGFSINIEVWDEEKRREICPGKSQISREKYFAAWKRATELLGKFTSSSVLIVGLDTPESIEDGIRQLIKIGIKPVIMPLKPFKGGSLLTLKPPEPAEVLRLSKIAGEEMRKAGADTNKFVGCERCGACTIEKDCLTTAK